MARKRKSSRTGNGRRLIGFVLVLIALFVLVALITHDGYDDDRITGMADVQLSPFEVQYHNQAGLVGAYVAFFSYILAGWLAYFAPLWLLLVAFRTLKFETAERLKAPATGALIVAVLGTTTFNLHILAERSIAVQNGAWGGIVAEYLALTCLKVLGLTGSYIVLGGAILIILLLYTPLRSLLALKLPSIPLDRVGSAFSATGRGVSRVLKPRQWLGMFREMIARRREAAEDEIPEEEAIDPRDRVINASPSNPHSEMSLDRLQDEDTARGQDRPGKAGKQRVSLKKPAEKLQVSTVEYVYPSLDLLSENSDAGPSVSKEELQFTARMAKDTLETFGVSIDGEIHAFPGPVITRFEFKPGVGVKVNQIVNLSDDLALALRAKRIRIIAPIPGKAAVGLEIPNRKAQTVNVRDILTSEQFNSRTHRLPLALGKTTSGEAYVTDLTRMPHLLIAGATGSGKSVCMNVLITSLLYRLHPVQVRFILIDPKMLELSVYSGIPHLARPVVTKPKRAEKVLTEAVVEMEARYRRLANASVRNIEDYNARQKNGEDQLPYIVIFVDELADLMMSSTSSKTELLITRLAQMARAVGIHLILATQRPSVDVITGLIKANFPARIAFQVSSKVDSRTILDANGAEKLLGNGDMLFLPSGQPEPIRIHGAYLSSDETDAIVKHIKDQGLDMMTLENISQNTGEVKEADVDVGDPLFKEACEVVIRHKQGSVSLLQRRLGIGYQRAARLIDKLEEAGVVSTFDGSKARDVLVDKTYLERMFSGDTQPASVSGDEN